MAGENEKEIKSFLKRAAELEGMLFSYEQACLNLEQHLRDDISDEAREKGQYQLGDSFPRRHETPGEMRARWEYNRQHNIIERTVQYVGDPSPNIHPPLGYPGTVKPEEPLGFFASVLIAPFLGALVGLFLAVPIIIFTDIRFKAAFLWSGLAVAALFVLGHTFGSTSVPKEPTNQSYLKEKKEYEEAVRARNAILAKELAIEAYVNKALPEIAPAEAKVREALKQHYAAGIVHEKYQNFLAVTQIYEYFDTGRCDELTGPNGAYNLYEAELRANVIIGQLGQIASQLEQIKQNQYMIYRAVQETNSLLGSISQDIRSLEGAVDINTAAINSFNASVMDRL